MREALNRVERQAALVRKSQPGTPAHRAATQALLVLQDSLHALIESRALLAEARRQTSAAASTRRSPATERPANFEKLERL